MANQETLKNKLSQVSNKSTKMQSLELMLVSKKTSFIELLPKNVNFDRFFRTVLFAIQKTPGLADCTPRSIIEAGLQCAQTGLEPNTPFGLAYLIPYKNRKSGVSECQFQIGYKGLVELVRRTDRVKNIYSLPIREKDFIEYQYGSDPKFIHRPDIQDSKVAGYYAFASLTDGSFHFHVMSIDAINKIKNRAKATFGPWVTDFDAMAQKTVLKQLCKMLPISIDSLKDIEYEDNRDFISMSKNENHSLEITGNEEADIEIELPEISNIDSSGEKSCDEPSDL